MIVEWMDYDGGEIIDESTLTAIEQGEYFSRSNPTYRRLDDGNIEITIDQGGFTEPDKRVSTIYRRILYPYGYKGSYKQNSQDLWNVWCSDCDQRILKRYMLREYAEQAIDQHYRLAH